MYYAKMHRVSNERILAACDEDVLGKTLREGEIKFKVGAFYDGSLVSEPELTSMLKDATSANLVGDGVVGVAAGLGLVDPANVIKVEGVPYAMTVIM